LNSSSSWHNDNVNLLLGLVEGVQEVLT